MGHWYGMWEVIQDRGLHLTLCGITQNINLSLSHFSTTMCMVYFSTEMDFLHNLSFWRTFGNYFFCSMEGKLITKFENFLWNTLLSPGQFGMLDSSWYAPMNCMRYLKIKRLLVSQPSQVACVLMLHCIGLIKKTKQKKNSLGSNRAISLFPSLNAIDISFISVQNSYGVGMLSTGDWYLENTKIWT